ncbi:MAG: C_GCAxxG_C_C family protein [Spirochaetes bacterium]|nr:C_GCAxxG_C_C family protein [Spirochaetota bacterium]
MSKEEMAIDYFKNGFNCAQSVLSAFMKDFNLDEISALKIAGGFGAGMGRLMETCGAVSGAYMVLGLKYGKYKKEDNESKEKTYSMVMEFNRSFREKFKSTNCGELLNCDLKTEEGRKYFNDNNLKEAVCEKCVEMAVSIIKKMI